MRKIAQSSLGTGSLGIHHLFWSAGILQAKYFDLHIG